MSGSEAQAREPSPHEPRSSTDETPEARPSFAHGASWTLGDSAGIDVVIDAAFDYRGNVTLTLRGGREVVGYLSNRQLDRGERFVEVFPTTGDSVERLCPDDIVGVTFSGRDTASGKSWETWVKKYNAKKEAEARGESTESVDLYPDAGGDGE